MNSPMTPEAFAQVVRKLSDEELARGIEVNRELILVEMFRQMPELMDEAALGDLVAVVEWRVGGREDGGHDVWQVSIANGQATVERDGSAEPTVRYTIDALDFLRLAAGMYEGPELFMSGRIAIEGDLFLGAQMPNIIRRPRDEGGA